MIMVRGQRKAFVLTLVAFLCIVGTQIVFWTFTYPANQQTNNWTVLPQNWMALLILVSGGFQYACVVFEWQRLGVARYDPVWTRIRPELRRVGACIERDVDVPAVLGAEVVARGVQKVAVEQHRGAGGTDDRNGFFRLL